MHLFMQRKMNLVVLAVLVVMVMMFKMYVHLKLVSSILINCFQAGFKYIIELFSSWFQVYY